MRPKDRARAKLVILEIIRQAGGEFRNKTNLFKAFWKAHLEYASRDCGYLTAWPIVRMPNGPGIDRFDMLLGELLQEGLIHVEQDDCGAYSAFVFRTTPDTSQAIEGQLGERELEAIRHGVEFADNRTASSVSDESHKLSRSWRTTPDGKELDIYLDLVSDAEYDQELARMSEMAHSARKVWSA